MVSFLLVGLLNDNLTRDTGVVRQNLKARPINDKTAKRYHQLARTSQSSRISDKRKYVGVSSDARLEFTCQVYMISN